MLDGVADERQALVALAQARAGVQCLAERARRLPLPRASSRAWPARAPAAAASPSACCTPAATVRSSIQAGLTPNNRCARRTASSQSSARAAVIALRGAQAHALQQQRRERRVLSQLAVAVGGGQLLGGLRVAARVEQAADQRDHARRAGEQPAAVDARRERAARIGLGLAQPPRAAQHPGPMGQRDRIVRDRAVALRGLEDAVQQPLGRLEAVAPAQGEHDPDDDDGPRALLEQRRHLPRGTLGDRGDLVGRGAGADERHEHVGQRDRLAGRVTAQGTTALERGVELGARPSP